MQGMTFYNGPSRVDRKPIVGIATGLQNPSQNAKTGPLVQVYIMRSDVDPITAVHRGDDYSICHTCRHRGEVITDPKTGKRKNINRSCYVTLFQGPRVVYRGFQDGRYPLVFPAHAGRVLTERKVRVGAYGDPGAIPSRVWDKVLAHAGEITSYTHLWRLFPELSSFCMASCDTEEERAEAKALGFRTYRVRPAGAPKLHGEGICPASSELGKAVQCTDCMLCGGNRTRAKADITIEAHGVGASHFEKALA